MDLLPTRLEARLIIFCLVAFWLSFGTVALAADPQPPGWALGLFFVGFASGGLFYWTVFRIAGRTTGRSPWVYLGFRLPRFSGPDSAWKIATEGWRILFTIIDPRWHIRVIRAAGWSVPACATLLVLSLTFAVGAGLVH